MRRTFVFLFVVVIVAATTLHVSAQGPKVVTGARDAARGTAAQGATPARVETPNLLQGTRVSGLSTIRATAVTSTNNPLRAAIVRLRNATTGRIFPTRLTDRTGLCVFSGIDAGTYVVELMGDDQTMLAATQIINVNAGEEMNVIVRLPFKIPPLGGLLGSSIPSATAVIALAAATGVAATTGAATSPAASGVR